MQQVDQAYYSARAREYERVYAKPERQVELQLLRDVIPTRFSDLSVLEVACGTGYWTQYIANFARAICAVDLSADTLAMARAKNLDPDRVRFLISDAMALPIDLGRFESSFCGFWWSHISRTAISEFLGSLHLHLPPGAKVVLLDNLYVEGSSTPISRRSAEGDTYQLRQLSNGSSYEVLKNFPTEQELRIQLGARARRVKYTSLQYYWYMEYEVAT
jgi:demethylmenaquinone methyltransferase/2-methoxy-6-polyprenyl-1,4-benzoquinol methylase